MQAYRLPVLLALSMLVTTSTLLYAASYTFTTIDLPGATPTAALGINLRGHIVGDYSDESGRRHGFLWHDGLFTTVDVPRAICTLL